MDARWTDDAVEVTINDDGPGFAPEIMGRIGEPYVTSRRGHPYEAGDEPTGLGLGFFIAKTLIEQTGGTVTARNRNRGGAIVTVRWPRGAIDGAAPPREEFQIMQKIIEELLLHTESTLQT